MTEKIKVIIENGPFTRIRHLEYMGEDFPVQYVRIEANGNDPPFLVVQIGASRFEVIEETKEELVEESALEQPENDNF